MRLPPARSPNASVSESSKSLTTFSQLTPPCEPDDEDQPTAAVGAAGTAAPGGSRRDAVLRKVLTAALVPGGADLRRAEAADRADLVVAGRARAIRVRRAGRADRAGRGLAIPAPIRRALHRGGAIAIVRARPRAEIQQRVVLGLQAR